MRAAWWLVTPVVLAALVAGSVSDAIKPRTQPPRSSSHSTSQLVLPSASTSPSVSLSSAEAFESAARAGMASARARAAVAAFMARAELVEGGMVGAGFLLDDVQYTSPTDAAADLHNCVRTLKPVCLTVVATTTDNWAHATGLAIPDTLADFVVSMPLGAGAVAIKVIDQAFGKSFPPFVLYPNGKAMPLRITHQPRALDAASHLVSAPHAWSFLSEVGAGAGSGHAFPGQAWFSGGVGTDKIWATDVEASEIFPVVGAPGGVPWENVPGRNLDMLSVSGYHKKAGEGVWRFAESADNARTWHSTDVRLPLGGEPRLDSDSWSEVHVVGPGHSQAIALADAPLDLPLYLKKLWRTGDEQSFRRVPLPWKRLAFGGMAFAADGALLLAEARDPGFLCPSGGCHAGRIWRLPANTTDMRPLPDAPTAFHGWAEGPLPAPIFIETLGNAGGGMIVARTGRRSIAVSSDGYTWNEVTPGR